LILRQTYQYHISDQTSRRLSWTVLQETPVPTPAFVLVLATTLAPLADAGVGPENGYVERLIQRAGNADSDSTRLLYLRELRRRDNLAESLRADLDRIIPEIERWVSDPALDYFGRQVRQSLDYDFELSEDSPLYPLTYIYRGRMLTWYALESGSVWRDPQRKRAFLDKAQRFFERARDAFPENRIIRMYLGEPVEPVKEYPGVTGAPAWAVYQREGLERLADVIEWWIDNRMRDDGQYGGGWGDDCEMWRWWTPILIGFEDPKINAAQAKFSAALLSQPHMQAGYTTRMSDVEHTAEDSADAITPMMHIAPDDPVWNQRALRLAELMQTQWTGRNERGFLQFTSTYFTAEKVDPTPTRACDTVYHPRVVQPTLLYWQRTGDARVTKLFAAWMDTWVDAAARLERGKPAGIIPTAIHWPGGTVGGLGENWWDPRNHGEHTLYLFPSAMGLMTHTLLLTHHVTGQEKYLEPVRSMAEARLDYLSGSRDEEPVSGSRMWCAAQLGGIADVAAKYRFLTGDTQFDALLAREMSPYLRCRRTGDMAPLVRALRQNAEALRINWPGYTSEVRYTDRVLRFPQLFAADGILNRSVEGIRSPRPSLLYSSVTGDPGTPDYFPLNAVRWLTRPRDIAVMVTDSGTDRLTTSLFHFGTEERPMGAELYLLAPGSYIFTLAARDADGDSRIKSESLTVSGRRTRIAFALPSRCLCRLSLKRQ
jgi:hypothetical protein